MEARATLPRRYLNKEDTIGKSRSLVALCTFFSDKFHSSLSSIILSNKYLRDPDESRGKGKFTNRMFSSRLSISLFIFIDFPLRHSWSRMNRIILLLFFFFFSVDPMFFVRLSYLPPLIIIALYFVSRVCIKCFISSSFTYLP